MHGTCSCPTSQAATQPSPLTPASSASFSGRVALGQTVRDTPIPKRPVIAPIPTAVAHSARKSLKGRALAIDSPFITLIILRKLAYTQSLPRNKTPNNYQVPNNTRTGKAAQDKHIARSGPCDSPRRGAHPALSLSLSLSLSLLSG